MYSRNFKILFSDCDPAGVLFFGRYYNIAHDTLEEFMRNNEIGWSKWFSNPSIIMPIRHSEADYYAPLIAGNEYSMELYVDKVTESSVYFSYKIKAEGRMISKILTIHTFADKEKFKKIEIPEDFKSVLIQHIKK